MKMDLAVNKYAFHWSYPEMLAEELGLFAANGITVEWHDATPREKVEKGKMYTDLLQAGTTDVYHAGEWACISRVLRLPDSWIVAKSDPARGTLNSSFSLFVRKESKVKKPSQLAAKSVAIEAGTGSHYTAMLDLERYLPRESINLVLQGEPHKRLVSLLNGEVEAASLVGPWADVGRALGLKCLLRTKRSNPTTIVVRRDMDAETLRRFFKAVNEAIRRIDATPARFRSSYYGHVKKIIEEMPPTVSRLEAKLRSTVKVSRWRPWQPYLAADFIGTYRWMTERNLVEPGHEADEVVACYSPGIFS